MVRLFSVFLGLAAGFLDASPRKNGFDLSGATIPVAEIFSGGPPRDGIPSIDNPQFEGTAEADRWLRPEDWVVSLEKEGEPRAYPLRILVWHEIVNDVIAGAPVAITYCPLCGTAMVFDSMAGGQKRTFGVSGLLYNSDVLMYDRETESLWSQLGMRAVSGPAVGSGLKLLNAEMIPWQVWKAENPAGQVLSRNTGVRRDYNRNAYRDYERSKHTLFPVPVYREDLEPKEWIAGVMVDDQAAAFPMEDLKSRGTVRARLGEAVITLEYDEARKTVKAWMDSTGDALPVTQAYWFAWQAFYPETALWRSPEAR